MNEHTPTISFNFTVFPNPLQCAQYVYKIGLSVSLASLSDCTRVGLWTSSQRECRKEHQQRIKSPGFYLTLGFYLVATELCGLGSSFLPPWALMYPCVEWELGAISKDLSFLHSLSGTKCIYCPGNS